MRRFMTSMAAFGFLSAVLGCTHTAGICDCDCCGTCGTHAIGPMQTLKPEPLNQMPKENGKDKAEEAPPAEKN